MMTDRELLELSAKALGLTCIKGAGGEFLLGPNIQGWIKWNPLEDDGDALRLAVDARIKIGHSGNEALACGELFNKDFCVSFTPEAEKYSALRRSIVNVAAEIGRSMP
jgi:hypothetical protein